MKRLLLTGLFLILLFTLSWGQDTGKKYKPTWESITSRPYPQWFRDCKLGIFIHWGLYSVPAYGGKESYSEWYLRGLDLNDSLRVSFQKRVYGEDFEYKDYAPLFKAELFDPDEWAQLFKESGAGYVLLVSKHHDGYCLWPSKFQPGWNTMDVGPERDIVGELTKAVRERGLRMGLYYSLAEWNHPLHDWYDDDPRSIGPYVEEYMIPQFRELISAYKPKVLFTDGEWWNTAKEWHAKQLMAWYFSLVGEEATVNNRWGHGNQRGFLTPEYSSGEINTDRPWAEVRGLGRSFGLNRNEDLEAYMTADELIHFFVNAVAHGGGIILNVGPKGDGQIPLLQQERLKQLGSWLDVNGEAIYKTTKWKKTHEEKPVTLNRVDKEIDFNWVRNSPGKPIKEDAFTVTWEGFIQPDYSEEYRFEAKADDGVRVWVDNQLVVDKWKKEEGDAEGNVMSGKDATEFTGKISLEKNKLYPIKIDYFENKQNASIRLSWSSKNQEKEVVPQNNLFTEQDKAVKGLNAVYQSQKSYLAYTQKDGNVYVTIFDWPGKELLIPEEIGHIDSVNLLGTDLQVGWKNRRDGILLDLSSIYANDLPCDYAWTFKVNRK